MINIRDEFFFLLNKLSEWKGNEGHVESSDLQVTSPTSRAASLTSQVMSPNSRVTSSNLRVVSVSPRVTNSNP